MSILDFIGHLSESIQEQIYFVLHDEGQSLEEKVDAIGSMVEDRAVLRKCYHFLKEKEKVDRKIRAHLSLIEEEHHEIARAILTDQALSTIEKLAAFQIFTSDKTFLKASLRFLQTFDVEEKEEETEYEIARIPPADYRPILNELDETTRITAEFVLDDDTNSNVEKLELLGEIIDDRELLRQFKSCFRQQKDEGLFLEHFPEDRRGELASLFRENSLGYEEKKGLLRYILKTPEERKKCRRYFKDQEKASIEAAKKENPDCESEQDDVISQRNLDFLGRCPDEMNILILGETGVGKSTFLNGIANYMKYRTMHEAKSNQNVEVLITCHFTHTGDDMKQVKVVCKSEDDVGNENLKTGESCTLAARTYVFKWNVRGKTKQIRLIDTPGVGDVAGFKRDQENFDNIFHHLADFKELHGICILMKPNESKLNASFTYCLGELLSKLHVSARKNLLFCFTNTRGTLFRPGESMAILNAYMKELEKKRDLQIPLNRSSLFCFDNESFRFLCAWNQGIRFSEGHIADFNASWKRSVEEVFRFFTRISQLPPHNIADTLCINNVRKVLDILTKPISQMNTKQKAIDKVLEEEVAAKASVTKEMAAEQPNLQRDQFTITRVKSGRIDTVCSSATCSPPHPESATEKLLKICHQSCNCVRARLDTCQDTNLQRCSCMNPTLYCKTCNCLWTCHMQIDWQLQVGTQKVVDAAVKAKIDKLQVKLDESDRNIAAANANKTAAAQESSKLKAQGAELASYLTTFAVLPYNENLKEYVEKLINEEKQKIGQGRAATDLLHLEQVVAAHEAQVAILSNTAVTKSSKTVADMTLMLEQLKKEPISASAQTEIDKMVVLQVRNTPMIRSKEVDLNSGWIGELFQ